MTPAEFRAACRKLRTLDPCPSVVRFRRRTLSKYHGATYDWDPTTIVICPTYPMAVQIDTMLHEWVHAQRLAEGADDWHEHPPEFWTRHGELYRAWHRER